ncbi:hypothetical protein L0128_16375 [candidate division KSB1 bacterium]|nr:hypothetical protein [candidate division KSB1 bacterium]
MKKSMFIFRLGLAVLFILTLALNEALAIPAFARRHKISCTTCHAPFPKLKPYGAEFAGNGFIMKEDEKAKDYISAGDDLLWLNRTFPIGVRFDAFAVYEQDHAVEQDLQSPWGIKILSGGTLFKNIGYYFYFFMNERGEVAGIEDAYLHFDNMFGTNLDLMVGQFQTSDPLMKRELRLTFEDYLIYKAKVGNSRTNLTYDRGLMALYSIDKTGTDLVGILVNGNGKESAGEDQKFDDDNHKNLGFRLNQSLGKLGSIGGYFYRGQEKSLFDENVNQITYWGPDFNLSVGPFELTTQYLVRNDTNPFFQYEDNEFKTTGIIAELIFAPQLDRSRFYLAGLYNKIDSDQETLNYQTMTLSGTYLLSRNLRLTAEYTRDLEFELNRVVLGLVSGF